MFLRVRIGNIPEMNAEFVVLPFFCDKGRMCVVAVN